MSNGKVLLLDLDGRTLTLAFARPGEAPAAHEVLSCRTQAELEAVIHARIDSLGEEPLVGAAVSAAGPLVNDAITTTQTGLRLSLRWLRQVVRRPKVYLLNDLAALAMGVPRAPSSQLIEIAAGEADAAGAAAVIGVGLGLGVAGLVPMPGDGWRAIPSEEGHIDSCPREVREIPVFDVIRRRRGDTTAERLLSQGGLIDIYDALAPSTEGELDDAEMVVARARAGDATAREAISIFSGVLGAFSRDITLSFAARGGLYVNSPLISDIDDLFDQEAFLRRYRQGGVMSDYLRGVRVCLVTGRPVLLGLSGLFTPNDRFYRPTDVAYLDC